MLFLEIQVDEGFMMSMLITKQLSKTQIKNRVNGVLYVN